MFNSDFFFDLFIALFALLNPLYAIPVFLGLTGEFAVRERRRIASIAAMTTIVALIVAALIGDLILALFGVHVASFKIAGGLIVLIIALGMLKGESEEREEAKRAIQQRASSSKCPSGKKLIGWNRL